MSKTKTIIKFEQSDVQTSENISRTIGFVKGKFLISLFKRSILDANPRRPKRNKVTSDIIDSLDNSPELFQFKSKGILIGTSTFKNLQRGRIELDFNHPRSEGILDGGHNMLSIGLYILWDYMEEKDWKKIKDWDALIDAWDEHYDEIKKDRDDLDFLVSLELITPSSGDPITVESFKSASIEICAARNNNSQLAKEAKANQRGFYDEIRKRLVRKNPELAARVEWKTNYVQSDEGKPIKVRDLVAFSWLPLSVLDQEGLLPTNSEDKKKQFSPKLIYSSKARVSEMFDNLFENKAVAKKTSNGKYELHNPSVGSAFEILCDLPELYDYLFLRMSDAANESGGNFNLIKAVKKVQTVSPFTGEESDYRIPDGFIIPLFYGLTVLMSVENEQVEWKIDPVEFLDDKLSEIMSGYKMAIEAGEKDPQKVAKSDLSYNLAIQQFRFSLQNYLS